MTRHALILGNNLSGLVTAYRLLHYGFHSSIVDPLLHLQPTPSASLPLLTEEPSPPLILHGFYHSTWALLQELSFSWPLASSPSVCLEFGTEGKQPIALPKPSQQAWIHPFTRLTFFKGLSWSDRWNVINFLEKQWEENRLTQHHPDNENVEAWLIAAKQSEHSLSHFWNPLCRFFLSCDLPQASLGSFIEVLSRYWFGQPTDATTFLAPPETHSELEAELRQLLSGKGVEFHSSQSTIHLHTATDRIQAIEADTTHFQAQAYISALTPQRLLPLLSERALARYAYFSSLHQIPEVYGQAIQFTLTDVFLPPRIILNFGPFDWISSQPRPQSKRTETVVTCMTLQKSVIQEYTEDGLIENAWTCLQNLFNLSPSPSQESSEIQIIRQAGPFFPCNRGTRTHRPLPKTPISNFFLAGPWTATNLPGSLESTIKSANACAEAVAKVFYGSVN